MTNTAPKRLVGAALQRHNEKLAREARREAEALAAPPAPDTSVEIDYREAPAEPTVSLSEVRRMVEAAVAAALTHQALAVPPPDPLPAPPAPVAYEGKFLKHYRHDDSPNKVIQERQMVETEPGVWEPEQPIPGRKIPFVRGHFYATTENQVRQLEWMRSRPRYGADAGGHPVVIGGDPAIYVDDGQGVVRVAPGRYVVQGSEAHRAYQRSLGLIPNG